MRRLIRWGFIGPLFGVGLSLPLIACITWLMDPELRRAIDLLLAVPFIYVTGFPAALMTGLAVQFLERRAMVPLVLRVIAALIGGFASNYLLLIFLTDSLIFDEFNWNWLPSVVFLFVVGGLATEGMLWMERRRDAVLKRKSGE